MIFIYTTCSNEKEAKKLGNSMITKKMAACVDFWPVQSCYHWDKELKCVSQFMIIVTTFETKIEEVNELISKNHSYSVPLIAGVDVRRINRSYKEWMMKEVP
ncbi:MAG: divalent-cation tolerance protein CutA [Patescibacteria group bacterium]|nr:divalent-cation tolerance protein CutA [Patescibacteria group bacterium]